MKKIWITALSATMMLLGWQGIALWIGRPALFPDITGLFGACVELLTAFTFYQSVCVTVLRGLSGILISFCMAFLLSVLFSRYKWIHESFKPLLAFIRSVPVISFILLALIFLQPEQIPVMIAFLTMFPLLCENLTKGFESLNPAPLVIAGTFRLRKANLYAHIYYPQLKPFIFSGLSSAMGFGWRAIIMGEVLSQCTFGIGSEMKRAQTFIDVPTLMAWTLVAVVISFFAEKGIEKLSEYRIPLFFKRKDKEEILPWQPPVIELQDISMSYGELHILEYVNLTFAPGKIYGISAPSGKGKSTLLNLINRTRHPSSGTINMPWHEGIACMSEKPELLPHLTVLENICLPLANLYTKKRAEYIAGLYLKLTEMETWADRSPGTLSYGQQQRSALSRALAFPSPILLLDEPFKGLDKELARRIAIRIREEHRLLKQTVIFVTHNPEELDLLAEQTIKL